MVRQLSATELDSLLEWRTRGMGAVEIHAKLVAARRKRRQQAPNITTVRRALSGKTHRRGRVETRGRKKKLSDVNVRRIEAARKELIKKADGEREVHWDDVLTRARVPRLHRSTAARSLQNAGYNVRWRPAREKPMRSDIDEAERRRICGKLRKLPEKYWQHRVDMYMDNKLWDLPVTPQGKRFLRKIKVRGHLRTPEEGLEDGFTKPNRKSHKVNTGGKVSVCAAIIGGRVRVWHYLTSKWTGAVAETLYKDVLHPALVKHRGKKRSYTILEDNDPTGYKSNRAKAAKAQLRLVPIEFPTRSPDLNPLDFSLWDEVMDRMEAGAPRGRESAEEYKARLRRTALAIPEKVIRSMLSSMAPRVLAVFQHKGGHIPRD